MEGRSHPFFHTGPGDQVVVELVVHPFAFCMVSGLSVGIAKIVGQAAVKGDASPFATGEPTQRLIRQAGAAVEFPMCKRFRTGLYPGDQVVQVKMPAQFQSSFCGDDFADFREFHNLTGCITSLLIAIQDFLVSGVRCQLIRFLLLTPDCKAFAQKMNKLRISMTSIGLLVNLFQ